jgi:hypothetical protein
MRTTLNLLTRDGAVYVAFQPALSAAQYGQLLELTRQPVTIDDMQKAVGTWAKTQGLKVSFDEFEEE